MIPRLRVQWSWRWTATLAALAALVMMASPGGGPARTLLTPLLSTLHGPLHRLTAHLARRWHDANPATMPAEAGAAAPTVRQLADENAQLRAALVGLTGQLAEARQLIDQLAAMRQTLPGTDWAAVVVRVVSRDAVPRRESLLTTRPDRPPWDRISRNRWATARLYAALPASPPPPLELDGNPVFWDQCLIGRVEAVAGGYCRIRLICDPDFQCPVEIVKPATGQTITTGVLVGRGAGRMSVEFVERDKAPVAVGDLLRLPLRPAGRDGPTPPHDPASLPVAVVVGRISRCDTQGPGQSPLLNIQAVPTVDLQQLSTVLIILDPP